MTTTCLNKKWFSSEERAQSAIYNMRARHQDTERLQPYQCTQCRKWHIGRTSPGAVDPTYRLPHADP